MGGDNDNNSNDLIRKREEFLSLMEHAKQCKDLKENNPAVMSVVSRLDKEVKKMEVEAMRRHILSCPNLSTESRAIRAALKSLDEAERYLDSNGKVGGRSVSPELDPVCLFDDSDSRDSTTSSSDFPSSSPTCSRLLNEDDDEDAILSAFSRNVGRHGNDAREKHNSKFMKGLKLFGVLLRTILFDFPLASLFLLLVATASTRQIYGDYFVPLMDALEWTDEKSNSRYTYYFRHCDRSDISTLDSNDFILDPLTTTPEEAVDVTLKHGVSVFPELLTPETSAAMREFVLRRNYSLQKDEGIPLISQHQRWSFAIGGDEDPSVPPVLREIATNALLQSSLDLLMGDDPAMVEFTAITSAYGAGDQHWHADNEFFASHMHYARSFVPMYSLFIPLQDTTAAMGATSACPGTHLCGDDSNLGDLCGKLDFRLTDSRGRLAKSKEDHVWKNGDGFLMHLNTFHRGPAHVDPNGTERVMLIMSISPRPKGPYLDTRQISLGTSYSNRWDMWGMTMKDLVDAETSMSMPWKVLRTLGIFKWKGARSSHDDKWGWDYLTVACSRIVNNQMGFRYDDLEKFVENISKHGFLAKYLFGHLPEGDGISETGWREYLHESLDRTMSVLVPAYAAISILYILIGFATRSGLRTVASILKVNATIGLVVFMLSYYLSQTYWGKDILSGRVHNSPFAPIDRNLGRDGIVSDTMVEDATTYPTKYDVFIGSRLDSTTQAGHNLIFNYQPGNMLWRSMIHDSKNLFSLDAYYPAPIRYNSIRDILKKVVASDGNFLRQDRNGDFTILSENESFRITETSLIAEANPLLKSIVQEISFLISECRHGRLQNTAMMNWHSVLSLQMLEKSIISSLNHFSSNEDFVRRQTKNTPNAQTLKVFSKAIPSTLSLHKNDEASKADDADYSNEKELRVGDFVEKHFDGDGWFRGRIVYKHRRIMVNILYDDGEYGQNIPFEEIRPFVPYVEGDRIEIFARKGRVAGTVQKVTAIGTLTILYDDGYLVPNVPIHDVHRLE